MNDCNPIRAICIQQPPNNGPVSGTSYQFENINTAGIGVFNALLGTLAQFNGVSGDGQYITVSFDAANSAIKVSFVPSALTIPVATTSVQGIDSLATQTEVNVGTDAQKIVTPATLTGRAASTVLAGLIQIATQGIVNTGTDNTQAVTALTLATILATLGTTATVTNAAARSVKVPLFKGQFLEQQDTQEIFLSTSTAAGAWVSISQISGNLNIGGSITLGTNLQQSTGDFVIQADGSFGNSQAFFDDTAAPTVANDLHITAIGKTLFIAEGSNAKQGTSTLTNGTVTIANSSVTANSRIQITRFAKNGSTAFGELSVLSRTAGTSFTVTANNPADTTLQTADQSSFAYTIFEPA